MEITASQVKSLREKTGVGLMECKRALSESNGDIDSAINILRERGLAKANKKADRSANQGRIFIETSTQRSIIFELNCETDFVANNDAFIQLGERIAKAAIEHNIDSEDAINSLSIDNQPLKDYLASYVLKLGENISVNNTKVITDTPHVTSYIHMNGKIGVVVKFNNDIDQETSKDIAMHIAASNPSYLDPSEVPNTILDNEKEIIKTQALNEGKPEQILDKIVQGRINKFYKESCLLEQAFVKDDKKQIKQVLPANTSIEQFLRYDLN
ncbi:MAG: elongation factor Ts [Actinobacteria bacterium]|nr:elongation factor Ts [Actinomycetota bacterium]